MHSLLKRQIRKFFGTAENIPAEWNGFIAAVNDAYCQFDVDRQMLERSLELSSQELLQSGEEMRSTYQALPDSVVRINDQGIILSYKPGNERDAWRTAGQAAGQRLHNLLGEEGSINLDLAVEIVRETRAPRSFDFTIDGAERREHFEARLQLVNQQQFIVLLRNITARREAEEELQHFTEKLHRSNQELQDFAYVASHDLKEPLRKVATFGDRLRTKCGEQLGEAGIDYLNRMQQAAARMQMLIDNLLSYSQVTTNARPFVPVDLNTLLEEVISDLESRIERTGGKIEFDALPVIKADPTQIRQLLQNLVGNALKFHKPDSAPIVRVTSEPLRNKLGETEFWKLTISDNGIGFDEKYLGKIFTIFQRLHGRDSYEGTGIGLAICRKIVERHGGSITASSAPDSGATFIVTLPVTDEKSQKTSRAARR